ncbi:TPA: AbrB/MazE/SpoVT family DNA-binding domain-containing protein [Candidatus Saccharibacteria bacterium]|nr:AbrB/MazE/SpoVT family DNA-binding domain-containing protein [Candidatus Saccharibacteria bacterium]HIO88055.1 AbrB/MazE/SpoVT family DNA-binding domain-containing protein [Candidatus Saccharibacteria bacterium]
MGRSTLENRNQRTLTKTASGSYVLTLPIELVRELNWKDGQKVQVSKSGKKLVVVD